MAKSLWDELEERGYLRGQQDNVLLVIGEKFGAVTESLAARVREIGDPGTLDALLCQAVRAKTLDEIRV